jgi:hypothetical protein
MQDIPIGAKEILEVLGGSSHLLQRKNVYTAALKPLVHSFTKCGANTIDVDRGDA